MAKNNKWFKNDADKSGIFKGTRGPAQDAGGADSDEKVKVSSNDTTPGYLNGKLVAGANVTLTEGADGADEILTISATDADTNDKVKVSADDSTEDYLEQKIVAGKSIIINTLFPAGDEDLQISADIKTGKSLWVDITNGNNATAIVGSLSYSYLTIGAAVTDAVAGDTVLVLPGVYSETLELNKDISVIGVGGYPVTTIAGTGGGGPTVSLGIGSITGFKVITYSGDAAIKYTGLLTTVSYLNQIAVSGPAGIAAAGTYGLHHNGTAKVIVNEFRFTGGNFDSFVHCDGQGILALTGMHVPGGGNITNAISATGGTGPTGTRLQLSDINSGSPTVTNAISLGEATIIIRNSALFNCVNGIHITTLNYNLQGTAIRLDSTGAYDILVDDMGLGTIFLGTINLTACELQEGKISIPTNFLASDHNWTFQDAKSTIDNASYRCFTDLTIGHAEKGFRGDFGAGCPTARGMLVYQYDDSSISYLNVSEAAASSDIGDTFTFASTSIDEALYFALSLQNDSDVLKCFGMELYVAGSRLGGTIVAEVWDGSGWAEVGMMETLAAPPYTPIVGQNIWGPVPLAKYSHLRLGIDNDTSWTKNDPPGLGTDYYWVRLRQSVAVGQAGIFGQAKLHTNTTRTNEDGLLEYFGNARRPKLQLMHNALLYELSSIAGKDQVIDFSADISIKIKKNKLEFNAIDGSGSTFQVSPGVDVSFPAIFRIAWQPESTNVGDIVMHIRYNIFKDGFLLDGSLATTTITYDGTPGNQPILTTGGIANELQYLDVPIDISSAVPGISYVALSFERDGPNGLDDFTGDMIISMVQLTAHEWVG